MTTGLSLEDNGNISFQVYSNENDSDIYCEGSAVIEPLSEAPVLHIEQLKARCRKKCCQRRLLCGICKGGNCIRTFTSRN